MPDNPFHTDTTYFDPKQPGGGSFIDYLPGQGSAALPTEAAPAATGEAAVGEQRLLPMGNGYVAVQVYLGNGLWKSVDFLPARGSGGSGRGPSIVGGTITGAAAPDPIGAALALAQKMAAEATADQDWADAAYDRWIAELKRIEVEQKRNVDEANRALGVQEEVGRRAGTIARDILPGMINAEQLNIPELNAIMGGPYKGLKLDMPAMFTQGTPGLAASQPLPAPDFGGLAPLPILEKPQGIDLVAFAELLAKGAAGFPGFPQMPPFATV